VFVNGPENPDIVGHMIVDPRLRGDPEDINWLRYHFLGLVSGHFDLEKMTRIVWWRTLKELVASIQE
jgi:hypothetical protein